MGKELLVDIEIEDLINGCLNNREFEQSFLYKKYYYLVYSVALKHINNKAEAEDLTQDIFVKLLANMHKFNGKNYQQLSVWIKTISRNFTIDIIRKNKHMVEINDKVLDCTIDTPFDDIFSNIDFEIMTHDINNAISNLSTQYRKVFELYYLSDYTHDEIAKELNLNVGTSKSNLFKAKRKLATALKQYNDKLN